MNAILAAMAGALGVYWYIGSAAQTGTPIGTPTGPSPTAGAPTGSNDTVNPAASAASPLSILAVDTNGPGAPAVVAPSQASAILEETTPKPVELPAIKPDTSVAQLPQDFQKLQSNFTTLFPNAEIPPQTLVTQTDFLETGQPVTTFAPTSKPIIKLDSGEVVPITAAGEPGGKYQGANWDTLSEFNKLIANIAARNKGLPIPYPGV